MGYIIKDIATITEPARVSLSGLPNFIIFESKTAGGTKFKARIFPTSGTEIIITVQDNEGGVRALNGTLDPAEVGGVVFFISSEILDTVENIKAAFLTSAYITANFDVYNEIDWGGGAVTTGGVIIEAKDNGAEFNLVIGATGATVTTLAAGTDTDTISEGENIVEIAIDLYADTVTEPIHTAPPAGSLGAFIITLSKSYNGLPVWFDLNGIAAQNLAFTPPLPDTWYNPGTLTAYRALARKGNYNQTPFYISEILYALSGYGALTDGREWLPYAYTAAPVPTLTEKPATPYRIGQREFLTFLLGAPLPGKQIGILQRAYDGAGAYLGAVTVGTVATSTLQAINTRQFTFDGLLSTYPDAVRVTASLVMGGAVISTPQEYDVRPECLHLQNEFYFLNRLGGWDTFNFDATTTEESKPVFETYARTVTPEYSAAQGVQGVHSADLETSLTVQGAPVSAEVSEWLKQLLASKVILDSEGRRVIVESFTLRETAGEDSAPIMRYRHSETFTNGN